MSDTISLDWIGGQLRAIQAEQRTLRAENELLRTTILNSLGEVVRVLSDRIGNFEALQEARIDHLASITGPRMDGLGSRLDRLESHMDQFESRMDRLESRMDQFESGQARLESRMDLIAAGFDQIIAQLSRIERREP